MILRCPFLFVILLTLAACGPKGSSLDDMNVTEVLLPNGAKILCQMMSRDIDVQRGMMFQDTLPKGHGMVLLFPREERRKAFTYNVRIPLDFVWLDHDLRVVEVVGNVPPCKSASAKECPTYGGVSRNRYMLELGAGEAAANGLKVGDVIRF